MRIWIGVIFLFLSFSLQAQVWKGAGIMYTQAAPNFDAPSKGSWVAVDTSSGYWYEWDKSDSVWVEMGARIQFTGTTGQPNYTPDQQMSRVAVNSGDSLYVYQTPSWSLISGGGGGAASDNQVVDTFTIVSNTLRLSLEDDAQPFKSVDLSPYLDDTDTQLSEEQVEDYAGGMVTGNTETRISVTYQDGDGTLDFVVDPNLSNYTNDAGFLTSEMDGSTTNELQSIDTLVLVGTTLGASLSSDGVIQKTVDLSSLQDGTGTDDQTLTIDSTASWYTVSIEDGNSVSFAKSAAGSDTQDLSIDSTGTNYTISLVDGGSVSFNKVTDTDTQLSEEQVEDYVGGMVTGNTETLITVTYQDGDGTIDFAVEQNLSNYTNDAGFLTSEVDGSTSNELQVVDTLLLSGTTLGVSLSSDGVIQKTVDLSSLQDGTGTDDQTLTIDSTASWYTVSIEDGNSVSFAKSAAGSDTQDLSIDSTGTNYTISLVDGGSVSFNKVTDTDTQLSEEQVEDYVGGMVTGNTETLITVTYQDGDGTIDFAVEQNLSNYTNDAGFLTSEVDGSTSNELQVVDTLLLSGTTLGVSLSSDGVIQKTVDLSSLQDGTGTDDQNLSVTGSGPTYVLDIEGGNDVTISAAGIATLSEPSANELRITATEVDGSATNELQTLSWSAGTGGQDEITLSDGGGTVTITDDVNDADSDATNEIQDLSYTAATGALGISDGGTGTTIPVMTATTRGLVPDGDGSGTDEFLREDGTWGVPPGAGGAGVTSVSGTTNRITSTGGSTPVIDIAATYVGQTSLTTLGTIGTGTWQGTILSPTYGGTGINNASRTLTLNTNSGALTFPTAGTYTFPNAATATLARTDAGQTFTGIQSMTSPAITTSITTPSGAFSLLTTGVTNINIGSAATTFAIGGSPTSSLTGNFFVNATASAATKTLNFGTGGASGSITNIRLGSSTAGATGTTYLESVAVNLSETPATNSTFSTSHLLMRAVGTGNIEKVAASGGGTSNFLRADGTWAALPTLAAGTYTPTLTGTANVASSTAYVCQYMRVGTVVTVSGKVEITPTTANTYTELGMTLPISSNLTADEQCSGSGGGKTTQVTAALIMGDATNDRAEIEMLPAAGSQIYYFTFTYQVL